MEIKKYAKENNIPIINDDGLELLLALIEQYQVTSILEIGTAIGYSALQMASVDSVKKIVTIERNEASYQQALLNTKANNKIKCLYGDALVLEVIGDFDLLFIDGAKAQYQKFFDKYIKQAKFVFVDNINFHGLVENPDLTTNRNTKQLVRKIKKFKENMLVSDNYHTTYYNKGDGVLFIRRSNHE
ncbi:MAG: O-methyltransferase [Erysipelotrichaceae bacterium]